MMNYRMLSYLFGIIALIEAALLTLPLLVALIYKESAVPFLLTIGILLVVGLPLIIKKPRDTRIYARDGFVAVAGSWILMTLFGALPFFFSGEFPSFIDALFESVSGFTTTGSSILTQVEMMPRGILFWRSFTHWVGGMGVLVFMLALLPADNGRAIHLLRAEVPGPTKDKLVPKMRQTALILYSIYFALTALLALLLLCVNMPLYDSLVNAFAVAGTGGFSVLDNSIAGYANPAAEWIIAIFMLVFGVNFNIYFLLLIKRLDAARKSEELRVFLCLCGISTAVITVNAFAHFATVADGFRTAFFQVASIISTTGFSTANYVRWPALSQMILMLLMITGACAGSTAGGMKLSRVMLLIKNTFRNLRQAIRPGSVTVVRLDGDVVEDKTLRAASNYLTLYVLCIVASTLLLSIGGFDFETNFSATLTCISNVGPGFGKIVGPVGNFSKFSPFAKLVLCFDMLLGRLEFIPLLAMLSPRTWKKS